MNKHLPLICYRRPAAPAAEPIWQTVAGSVLLLLICYLALIAS